MSVRQIRKELKELSGWKYRNHSIAKRFIFENYDETTAFVNDVIRIARIEDHHPDIRFGYKKCMITYTTHAALGITWKDFICAAKIERLFSLAQRKV